jgi:Flp pilus assembly pilin Flp
LSRLDARKAREMHKRPRLRLVTTLLRGRLLSDEEGATAIEYALIASGVGAAVAAAVYNLGSITRGLYSHLYSML